MSHQNIPKNIIAYPIISIMMKLELHLFICFRNKSPHQNGFFRKKSKNFKSNCIRLRKNNNKDKNLKIFLTITTKKIKKYVWGGKLTNLSTVFGLEFSASLTKFISGYLKKSKKTVKSHLLLLLLYFNFFSNFIFIKRNLKKS